MPAQQASIITEILPHVASVGTQYQLDVRVPFISEAFQIAPDPVEFVWYLGLKFIYTVPIQKHHSDAISLGVSIYDIDYEYNYWSPKYELYTRNYSHGDTSGFPETTIEHELPNLYQFLHFHKMYSDNGSLSNAEQEALSLKMNPRPDLYNQSSYAANLTFHSYAEILDEDFETWASDYKKMIQNFTVNGVNLTPLAGRTGHAHYSDSFYMKDPNNKRELFPYFTKLTFSADKGMATLSDIIYDLGIQNSFGSFFLANNVANFIPETQHKSVATLTDQLNVNSPEEFKYKTADTSLATSFVPTHSVTKIAQPDIQFSPCQEEEQDTFFDERLKQRLNCIPLDDFIADYYETALFAANNPSSSNSCDIVTALLQLKSFMDKLDQFKEDHDGTGYTEYCMYRVDKYAIIDGQKDLIDYHIFFNKSDVEEFKMYDTKVAYDQEYFYECYVYILAQSYSRTELAPNNTDQGWVDGAVFANVDGITNGEAYWRKTINDSGTLPVHGFDVLNYNVGTPSNPDMTCAGRPDCGDPWYFKLSWGFGKSRLDLKKLLAID